MLNFKQKTLSIILPFIFLNFSYASETDFLPKNTVIINTKSHYFQNKVYTYYKLRDELTGKLDLFVADVNGRKIEELVNKFHVPGEYELEINPQYLSSGNYLYKLETPSMEIIKKMTIIH